MRCHLEWCFGKGLVMTKKLNPPVCGTLNASERETHRGAQAPFWSSVRRFQNDERGSLIIFSLYLFAMMLVIGGLAVDVMRAEHRRTRIQYTLDRAVLAAASMEQTVPAQEVVDDYFEKAGLGSISPTVTVEESGNTSATLRRRVVADMSGVGTTPTIETIFLRMDIRKAFGLSSSGRVEYLATPAAASAEDGVSRVEVSLVVDVSGSMGWASQSGGTKINALRAAARQFVDILLLEQPEENAYSISIVPYSAQVNAGAALLNRMNVTNEHSYSDCVDFDEADYSTTAINPLVPLQRGGHIAVYSSRHGSKINKAHWPCMTDDQQYVTAADYEILPLSGDAATLKTYINNLTPHGNTSTEIGLKWGAALLDPSMRQTVSGLIDDGVVDSDFSNRPFDYGNVGVMKVIVVMTDGANTELKTLRPQFRSGTSNIWFYKRNNNTYRYWVYNPNHPGSQKYKFLEYNKHHNLRKEGWRNAPGPNGVELSYPELWKYNTVPFVSWYLRNEAEIPSAGTEVDTVQQPRKDPRMKAICEAAKANNIIIYTIGFEVEDDNAFKLEKCASSKNKFYRVAGSAALKTAFEEIAASLKSLRLIR